MQNFKIDTFCGLSTSLLLACALLGPGNASAEVVCVNDAANSRYACPAVFPATVGEFDQVLDFQQFRSSWGDLIRVEVALDARIMLSSRTGTPDLRNHYP
ncbi:MAG TPA: hypothetical protein VN442_05950 [Bryobacteraceae bacterium]|nr:hypothetical protein [Bryobacteraceae bacterium]